MVPSARRLVKVSWKRGEMQNSRCIALESSCPLALFSFLPRWQHCRLHAQGADVRSGSLLRNSSETSETKLNSATVRAGVRSMQAAMETVVETPRRE